MAKIIQFPVKSSNAYTNLEQLIAISDSTASLEIRLPQSHWL